MARLPEDLTESPDPANTTGFPGEDVLSDVLRSVRLSGSLQFCFAPTGCWQTDATPSLSNLAGNGGNVTPFHIVVEGSCWLKMDGAEWVLDEGDIVAFPFGTAHQLGAGSGGRLITPVGDLPPKPWRGIPVLRYGDAADRVRLLCGYLHCDAVSFRPLRAALPALLHVRTAQAPEADWLRTTIRQIIAEAERPATGSLALLERLTEIAFIEMLRHQIAAARGAAGWLGALADPCLGRCLSLIHEDPARDWSVRDLAAAAGLSRSTLMERFEAVLGMSPIRYVRSWRLHLASQALSTTTKPVAAIAHDAGYGTEAAFNRAFSRAFGIPPSTWRRSLWQPSPASAEAGR